MNFSHNTYAHIPLIKSHSSNPTSRVKERCVCYLLALDEINGIMKSNETLWFDWIHNVVGFQDEYMSNYFIKRLVGFPNGIKSGKSPANFVTSLGCQRNKTHNMVDPECARRDRYSLFEDLFVTVRQVLLCFVLNCIVLYCTVLFFNILDIYSRYLFLFLTLRQALWFSDLFCSKPCIPLY